jgi:ubiquinone/menaquinone biosynthesis C-methylase UbiE
MSTIAKHFDELARSYEDYRLARWYKAQAEQVITALSGCKDGVLLDIGCGTGWLLRKALKQYPNLRGIGVDISKDMIAVAQSKASAEQIDRLSFVQGDWETMEIGIVEELANSRPVVVAVCASSMHYFADPVSAMRKVQNSLSPGGKLLLLDRANDSSMLTRTWALIHKYILRDAVRFYSVSAICDMLCEAGFRDAYLLWNIKKLAWKGKCYTSIALLEARK